MNYLVLLNTSKEIPRQSLYINLSTSIFYEHRKGSERIGSGSASRRRIIQKAESVKMKVLGEKNVFCVIQLLQHINIPGETFFTVVEHGTCEK